MSPSTGLGPRGASLQERGGLRWPVGDTIARTSRLSISILFGQRGPQLDRLTRCRVFLDPIEKLPSASEMRRSTGFNPSLDRRDDRGCLLAGAAGMSA